MLTAGAALCGITLCLAPLAGRTSFELAGERAAFDTRFSVPDLKVGNDARLNAARDPFVPQAGPAQAAMPMHATRAALGTVSAVVTGAAPRALVTDGSRVRVVAVGDAMDGSRVASIDTAGVHLQNGVTLHLPETRP
jgi:hypothetical protein